MSVRLTALASVLALSAFGAQATSLSNGSFEVHSNADSLGSRTYCYLGSTSAVGCTGTIADWSDGAVHIASSSSPWGFPNGQAGWNPSFGNSLVGLQGASYISQQVTFDTTGSFQLSWYDAGRAGYDDSRYQVQLDGVALTTQNIQAGGGWNQRLLNFSTTAGVHTLTWQGLIISPDGTAFIDNAALAPVPEPTSAVLMLGGLAALGWRRRKA